jgi:hypothetical protein
MPQSTLSTIVAPPAHALITRIVMSIPSFRQVGTEELRPFSQ